MIYPKVERRESKEFVGLFGLYRDRAKRGKHLYRLYRGRSWRRARTFNWIRRKEFRPGRIRWRDVPTEAFRIDRIPAETRSETVFADSS